MARIRSNARLTRCAGAAVAVFAIGGFAAGSAAAETVSFTGTDNGAPVSGSGTAIGSLMTPSNIVLTDLLGTNNTSQNVTTTDNWTFSIPATEFGATVTGEEISLQNFSFSGVVDSVSLYSGTPSGTSALLASGTPSGSFANFLLDDLTNTGSYFLQIKSTLSPDASGSYTGTIVAAQASPPQAVPVPATLPLLLSSVATLGIAARRRKSP